MRSVHQVSKPLSFEQANNIAYQVLAKDASISSLAREHQTSRQTIRKERDRVHMIFYLKPDQIMRHDLLFMISFWMK